MIGSVTIYRKLLTQVEIDANVSTNLDFVNDSVIQYNRIDGVIVRYAKSAGGVISPVDFTSSGLLKGVSNTVIQTSLEAMGVGEAYFITANNTIFATDDILANSWVTRVSGTGAITDLTDFDIHTISGGSGLFKGAKDVILQSNLESLAIGEAYFVQDNNTIFATDDLPINSFVTRVSGTGVITDLTDFDIHTISTEADKESNSTFYVSDTGDDLADGSVTRPFSTLQHAVDTAGGADTVVVTSGNYNENLNFSNGQSRTIKSLSSDTGVVLDGTLSFGANGSIYTVLEKLEVRETVSTAGLGGIRMNDCKITVSSGNALEVNGALTGNIVLDGTQITGGAINISTTNTVDTQIKNAWCPVELIISSGVVFLENLSAIGKITLNGGVLVINRCSFLKDGSDVSIQINNTATAVSGSAIYLTEYNNFQQADLSFGHIERQSALADCPIIATGSVVDDATSHVLQGVEIIPASTLDYNLVGYTPANYATPALNIVKEHLARIDDALAIAGDGGRVYKLIYPTSTKSELIGMKQGQIVIFVSDRPDDASSFMSGNAFSSRDFLEATADILVEPTNLADFNLFENPVSESLSAFVGCQDTITQAELEALEVGQSYFIKQDVNLFGVRDITANSFVTRISGSGAITDLTDFDVHNTDMDLRIIELDKAVYVNSDTTKGNDFSGNGSRAKPFRTKQTALESFAEGSEKVIYITGSSGDNLTFRANDADITVITEAGTTHSGITNLVTNNDNIKFESMGGESTYISTINDGSLGNITFDVDVTGLYFKTGGSGGSNPAGVLEFGVNSDITGIELSVTGNSTVRTLGKGAMGELIQSNGDVQLLHTGSVVCPKLSGGVTPATGTPKTTFGSEVQLIADAGDSLVSTADNSTVNIQGATTLQPDDTTYGVIDFSGATVNTECNVWVNSQLARTGDTFPLNGKTLVNDATNLKSNHTPVNYSASDDSVWSSIAGIDAALSGIGGDITNKNILMNKRFIINQRQVASKTSNADGYGVDAWYFDSANNVMKQVVRENEYTPNALHSIGIYAGNTLGLISSSTLTSPASGDWTVSVPVTADAVQLELGDSSGLFDIPSFLSDVERCRTLFQKSYRYSHAIGTNTDFNSENHLSLNGSDFYSLGVIKLIPEMKTTPEITLYSLTGNATLITETNTGTQRNSLLTDVATGVFRVRVPAQMSGQYRYSWHYTADASPIPA